jgi:hypothetical protein
MSDQNPFRLVDEEQEWRDAELRNAMRRHPAGNQLPTKTINEFLADEEFESRVQLVAMNNVALLLSKHRDYGPKNISQAPGGALNGLRVRMHDKLARINHLLDNGASPENESLIDSFLDLGNYAIIAQLVIRGEWPNE